MNLPFKFSFQGREIIVKEYSLCDNFLSMIRGLMFRNKNYSKPLLFVWKNARIRPIHSFFCRKFIAVWFLSGKIIDVKMVRPWLVSVTPKSKFDELLEIPLNSSEFRNI